MLIRFRVENHRSIKHEQELSLVASSLSEREDSLVRAERYDLDLLRAAAIYGANASGKSTVFDALSFMRSAVLDSQRLWAPNGEIPRAPFALDPNTAEAPSLFAADLLLDGIRYEYGFVVDTSRVLEEWLHAYPRGRRQEWFTRDAGREEEFAFSRLFPGENRTIGALTRPNSLFLSAGAQNNHEVLVPIYDWFARLWVVEEKLRGRLERLVRIACSDDDYRASVLNILRSADLGITEIEMTRVESSSPETQLPGIRLAFESPQATRIQFRHQAYGTESGVVLPFDDESQGTKTLFSLAGPMVDALSTGSTLVVDELERSLHPHVAMEIVRIFNDPAANPRNAQLLFNTHDTNLLDTSILRRDQIWFTEKGDDGATRLFPLTDFRARKYENLERGYLQGRYGAVPSVRTPDLRIAGD